MSSERLRQVPCGAVPRSGPLDGGLRKPAALLRNGEVRERTEAWMIARHTAAITRTSRIGECSTRQSKRSRRRLRSEAATDCSTCARHASRRSLLLPGSAVENSGHAWIVARLRPLHLVRHLTLGGVNSTLRRLAPIVSNARTPPVRLAWCYAACQRAASSSPVITPASAGAPSIPAGRARR